VRERPTSDRPIVESVWQWTNHGAIEAPKLGRARTRKSGRACVCGGAQRVELSLPCERRGRAMTRRGRGWCRPALLVTAVSQLLLPTVQAATFSRVAHGTIKMSGTITAGDAAGLRALAQGEQHVLSRRSRNHRGRMMDAAQGGDRGSPA
jgi:hypothetical protein